MARKRPVPSGERAGLYVRVSLDRSAKGVQDEIVSPETQEDRARAYCHAQGWTVLAVERDIDESAFRQHYSRRQGLMRLLEAVERGEITKIVVWKFSRLSRRLKEFVEICDRVERAGGGVVSVSEQVDTSTPAGRLIRNILASFAQFQSEELSEQIYETWITLAKQGRRPPGWAPFGTRNNRGILEPDPETYDTLMFIFKTFVETGSVRAVLDALLERRLPPPRGDEWHVVSIRRILTNPAYIGQLNWAGATYTGLWKPIIPIDLWRQAQSILDGRRQQITRRDAWMLTGLVICGTCGQTMWVKYGVRSGNHVTGEPAGYQRVYACLSHSSGRKNCCDAPYVHADELEDAVWGIILQLSEQADWQAQFDSWQSATDDEEAEGRIQQLQREREKLQRAVNQLFDLLAEEVITKEQFREQNTRYIERLRAIDEELDTLLNRQHQAIDPARARELFRAAPAATSPAERRAILIDLGAQVIVTQRRVYLDVLGLRFNLRGRRFRDTFRFGPEYQRLDYPGRVLSDKQIEFIRRTYHWADKQEIARRIGRSYKALIKAASRLKREGLL